MGMDDNKKAKQIDGLLAKLAAHREGRLSPPPIEGFQMNALLREVERTRGPSQVRKDSSGLWLTRFWPALAFGVSAIVMAVILANQMRWKSRSVQKADGAQSGTVTLANGTQENRATLAGASAPGPDSDIARSLLSEGSSNGRVIGLDLLSSHYFEQYQMWTRAGSKKNADKAYQQMLEHMQKNPQLAAMALQRLPPEHAKYHPHMTKDCSLLKGLKPGDKFDAAGHAEAIISESLACPICNAPSSGDNNGKPNQNPRPQPGDSDGAKVDSHSAAIARGSLRYAAGMNWLPAGMDDKFFNSLSDVEAVAMAEMWTEFASPDSKKSSQVDLGRHVAALAESMKDSPDYATSDSGDAKYPYTRNRFVYDVLVAAGLPVHLRDRWDGLLQPQYPPLAGDYADPLHEIPGLPVIHGMPRPGDIVAVPLDSDNASGHVGILLTYDPVTGMGRSIYVSSAQAPFTVREGNFGFRPIDVGVVFRRPTWTAKGP